MDFTIITLLIRGILHNTAIIFGDKNNQQIKFVTLPL